jgi:ribonuclease III family protein
VIDIPPDPDSLSLRLLANLGDAVYNLHIRELFISRSATVDQMHRLVNKQVNARAQAETLRKLTDNLNEKELDLIRRARNLKSSNYKKDQQAIYRQATAFEALIGYLHLTDPDRLKELLKELEPKEQLEEQPAEHTKI